MCVPNEWSMQCSYFIALYLNLPWIFQTEFIHLRNEAAALFFLHSDTTFWQHYKTPLNSYFFLMSNAFSQWRNGKLMAKHHLPQRIVWIFSWVTWKSLYVLFFWDGKCRSFDNFHMKKVTGVCNSNFGMNEFWDPCWWWSRAKFKWPDISFDFRHKGSNLMFAQHLTWAGGKRTRKTWQTFSPWISKEANRTCPLSAINPVGCKICNSSKFN